MKLKTYLVEQVFDVDSADDFVKDLEKSIKAPFVKAQKSTLGGPKNVSVLLRLSLDPKNEWVNNIFENSRYMHFHFDNKGTIEQFGKDYRIKMKFRKARVKDTASAIKKINDYIMKVNKEKGV